MLSKTSNFTYQKIHEEAIISSSPEDEIKLFIKNYFQKFSRKEEYNVISLCDTLIKVIFYYTIVGDILQ